MKLDDDELYMNIVALNMMYIFVVEKFFIWNFLEFQNIVLILGFWNLKIKIFKPHWLLKWYVPKL